MRQGETGKEEGEARRPVKTRWKRCRTRLLNAKGKEREGEEEATHPTKAWRTTLKDTVKRDGGGAR